MGGSLNLKMSASAHSKNFLFFVHMHFIPSSSNQSSFPSNNFSLHNFKITLPLLKIHPMRKIPLLILALTLSLTSIMSANLFAQNVKDVKAPPELFLQMGNTSNTYYNTITNSTVGTGALLDTTSNTTALILQCVNYAIGLNTVTLNGITIPKVATDTLYPMTLNGDGRISLYAKVLKCTGTDTVVITPVESIDGIAWYTVPGLSAITLYPTSLTVPLSADWTVNAGYFPIVRSSLHYGLKFVGVGSSTMAVKGWIDYFVQIKK